MDVGIRRAGPHYVSARLLVCDRQSGGLRIEGPHDHPMRAYLNGRAGRIEWIRIIALCGSSQHVDNTGDRVGRLRFAGFEIRSPLHRRRIRAHGGLPDHVWIPRHTGEAVTALSEHDHFALSIRVDDPCRVGDFWRSRRQGTCDLGLSRLARVCGGSMIRGLGLSCASRVRNVHE